MRTPCSATSADQTAPSPLLRAPPRLHPRAPLAGITLAAALLAAGCGDGGEASPTPSPSSSAAPKASEADPVSIGADGRTFRFEGKALTANGVYGPVAHITDGSWPQGYLQQNEAVIDALAAHGLNWMRLWVNWGALSSGTGWDDEVLTPWPRTGGGIALDGEPTMSLKAPNDAWLDLLADTVDYARENHVVVQVVLLDCWHVGYGAVPGPGVGDEDGDGVGDYFELDYHNAQNNDTIGNTDLCDWTSPGSPARDANERLVRAAVERLGVYPNVVWEVCNEMREPAPGATGCAKGNPRTAVGHPAFYTDMATVIRAAEASANLPSHLIMPVDLPEHRDVGLHGKCPVSEGQVDQIHTALVGQAQGTAQPLILDNDHPNCDDPCPGNVCELTAQWAFAAFTAGAHADLFFDDIKTRTVLETQTTDARLHAAASVGRLLRDFDIDPTGMVTSDASASAGWTRSRAGSHYLTFLPHGGAVQLVGVSGTCQYRWFDVLSDDPQSGAAVTQGACGVTLTAPTAGPVVLESKVVVTTPPDQTDPIGFLGSLNSQGVALGWTCDPDAPATSIEVHFWTSDWLTFCGKTLANGPSEPAVNTACGGGTAHRYGLTLAPACAGKPVMAWGIDTVHGIGLLTGSPKTFTPTSITRTPTDDAWVDQTAPNANHGNDASLTLRSINGSAGGQHGYLKLDRAGIPATVTRATLTLRTGPVPIASLGVYRIDHTAWTEGTLTWANASTASLGSVVTNNLPANTTVTIDVTALVNKAPVASAPGLLTLALAQGGSTSLTVLSTESASSPSLTVEF